MATNIQVAVRVRPFLPFEAGSKTCIDILPGDDQADAASQHDNLSQGKSVRIGPHGRSNRNGHTFTFDKCFSGLATQVELYSTLVVPLLKSCVEGYNATTLAYGQTGAGEYRISFVFVFGFLNWLVVVLLILLCDAISPHN